MQSDSTFNISPDELLKAYALGYFPMARSREDDDVVWVLPDERGVIDLNDARAPKRLLQTVKQDVFSITVNTAFADVVDGCAEATNARPDTWINDTIIESYNDLHRLGHAHSIECWRDGKLAGGLYGVALGAAFCGESMFSRERDASKVVMVHLMARLKLGGYHFLDAQFFNEHLVQFGLKGIPNDDYQIMLKKAVGAKADYMAAGDQLSTTRVLQSITQTS